MKIRDVIEALFLVAAILVVINFLFILPYSFMKYVWLVAGIAFLFKGIESLVNKSIRRSQHPLLTALLLIAAPCAFINALGLTLPELLSRWSQ